MDAITTKQISKRLSYVLRHNPGDIGLALDEAGWADVEELLAGLARHGKAITLRTLDEVVANNDKQRFAFSEDRTRIRASQGHSIEVALDYQPSAPPDVLFHGTVDRFLDAIRRQGLVKGKRHHVHLSAERDTALAVGGRRGRPVLLLIAAGAMHAGGCEFFVTPNRVWLTDCVPTEFIEFP